MRCQVIELTRSGTRVKQLAVTVAISEATVCNWTKQDRIDRGETHSSSRPVSRWPLHKR
jgi:transposase